MPLFQDLEMPELSLFKDGRKYDGTQIFKEENVIISGGGKTTFGKKMFADWSFTEYADCRYLPMKPKNNTETIIIDEIDNSPTPEEYIDFYKNVKCRKIWLTDYGNELNLNSNSYELVVSTLGKTKLLRSLGVDIKDNRFYGNDLNELCLAATNNDTYIGAIEQIAYKKFGSLPPQITEINEYEPAMSEFHRLDIIDMYEKSAGFLFNNQEFDTRVLSAFRILNGKPAVSYVEKELLEQYNNIKTTLPQIKNEIGRFVL